MLGVVTGLCAVVAAGAFGAFWRERNLRLRTVKVISVEKPVETPPKPVAAPPPVNLQTEKMEALALLAGGVAHDFNNIISIIDGYARMAEKLVPAGSDAANHMARIHLASERGAALTKKLLTFGRHNVVSSKAVDVGRMVQEQEAMVKPLLDPSINLIVGVDKEMFIECAPDALAQVITNLIINARDAMPGGGTIIVDARRVGSSALRVPIKAEHRGKEFVRISVTDAGIGISDEIKAKIFDPFFTTKPQGKGTGLGLSLVYAIMRQSGGYLDFDSSPGRGTSMWLYFPMSDKKAEAQIAPEKKRQGFAGVTALVTEDEPDLLHVVCDVLEDMGMRVIPATCGRDALALQREFKGKIDFLLTDVVMPEMDGARLASEMNKVRPDTKIIFMSGYPTRGTMAKVRLPEDARLLAKPIAYDHLAGVIDDLLTEKVDGDKDGKVMPRWQSS